MKPCHPTPVRRFSQPRLRVGLGVVALAMATATLTPVLRGRTSPPKMARHTARRAYDEALQRDAARWVPERLAVSKGLLDSSAAEYRRQAARLLPLRNYESSRHLLERAETHAWKTARAALAQRRAVENAAHEQLRLSAEFVSIGSEFAVLMPLSSRESQDLAEARLRLKEAEGLLQSGKIEAATFLGARAESLASRVGAGCTQRAGRYADLRLLESWRHLRDETVAWSRHSGQAAIVVSKVAHTLTLYRAGVVKQRYDVDLGSNSVAAKKMAGDAATPEGKYRIVAKRGVGHSIYYKALLLDYPTPEDVAAHEELRRSGVSTSGPGGQIEIHGEGGLRKDWTRGCVALTNDEMDRLFPAVRIGTPVVIVGSHGDGGPIVELALRYRHAVGEELP